ncbi:MAG: EF-hand domain-containing protein [Psychroserpens sp.]|uniref:EF-hand domain-containing protein n=1 Tax=Psychroserpens sp. TaxID=2020870 RepID=UPI00300388BC
MGEVEQEEPRGQQGGQAGRPNIARLFEKMDNNNDGRLSPKEVKGPLANNFSKIDTNNDGFLTKEEIEKAPRPNGQRSQGRRD